MVKTCAARTGVVSVFVFSLGDVGGHGFLVFALGYLSHDTVVAFSSWSCSWAGCSKALLHALCVLASYLAVPVCLFICLFLLAALSETTGANSRTPPYLAVVF